MSTGVILGLCLALVSAFASVVLGRNLARSITAGMVAFAGLSIALVSANAGFVGLVAMTIALLMLATIQLFGWMLVDVERDHLPPTDRATWLARSLAFLLLGAGLMLLAMAALDRGLLMPVEAPAGMPAPRVIGELLFGAWRDLATLCGIALSAGLLATLMLLHDDGGRR